MEFILGIIGLIVLAVIGYVVFRFLAGAVVLIVMIVGGIIGIAIVIYIIGEIFSGLFVNVLPLIQLIC